MPVSDVLKSFRQGGYAEKPNKGPEESSAGPRMIKLTEEEAKGISAGNPGESVTVQVSGRLEGNHFTVMSVQGSGGMPDENEMAAQVMGKPPMSSQTMPSPS